MVISRYTPLNLLEIQAPRYKDRTVLVAIYKVKTANKIIFTKAKHLLGREYFLAGEKAKTYPKTTNGKLDCYAIPLDDLEVLEYKEDLE